MLACGLEPDDQSRSGLACMGDQQTRDQEQAASQESMALTQAPSKIEL